MLLAGSGCVAGPFFTLPSAAENSLWWQGHLITPPAISFTAQLVGALGRERLELALRRWVTTTP